MWRMPVGRSSSRVPPGKERGSSPASHCPVSERRSGGARVRVVLADDHPTIRAGLRRIFERGDAVEVVAEAGDGRTLLQQVQALGPDVVVLDLSMPELNGIDATRAIRSQHSATRVLVLSVHCPAAT